MADNDTATPNTTNHAATPNPLTPTTTAAAAVAQPRRVPAAVHAIPGLSWRHEKIPLPLFTEEGAPLPDPNLVDYIGCGFRYNKKIPRHRFYLDASLDDCRPDGRKRMIAHVITACAAVYCEVYCHGWDRSIPASRFSCVHGRRRQWVRDDQRVRKRQRTPFANCGCRFNFWVFWEPSKNDENDDENRGRWYVSDNGTGTPCHTNHALPPSNARLVSTTSDEENDTTTKVSASGRAQRTVLGHNNTEQKEDSCFAANNSNSDTGAATLSPMKTTTTTQQQQQQLHLSNNSKPVPPLITPWDKVSCDHDNSNNNVDNHSDEISAGSGFPTEGGDFHHHNNNNINSHHTLLCWNLWKTSSNRQDLCQAAYTELATLAATDFAIFQKMHFGIHKLLEEARVRAHCNNQHQHRASEVRQSLMTTATTTVSFPVDTKQTTATTNQPHSNR